MSQLLFVWKRKPRCLAEDFRGAMDMFAQINIVNGEASKAVAPPRPKPPSPPPARRKLLIKCKIWKKVLIFFENDI